MRANRLISALLMLQAHGRLTARELAMRLEVSERTVRRDMEALSAAGVPVFELNDSQAGWQFDENWRAQSPEVDEVELGALLMAQTRVIGGGRLAAAAERGFDKLMSALPVSLRERATSSRQRVYVDPTGWRGTTENLSMLPIVQDAVSLDRKLAIWYWKRAASAWSELSIRSALSPRAAPGISWRARPTDFVPIACHGLKMPDWL